MLSLRRARSLLAAVLFVGLAGPPMAVGLEGPVVLGFGAEYAAPDGGCATHRGIDVGQPPGSEVTAPVSGRVRFAGRVPGAGGGTVGCVSIESERGTVTLLPLETVRVTAGEMLDAGDPVATLAPEGDPSSPGPHLHVGLKRGDVYLDPTILLAAPAAPAPDADRVVEAEPAVDRITAAVPSPAPAPAPAGQSADAPQSASSPAVQAESPLALNGPEATARAEVNVAGQPGVSVPVSSPEPGVRSATRAVVAFPLALEMPRGALSPVTRATAGVWTPDDRRLTGFGAPAFAVLGAACAAGALIVTRRALGRRVTSAGPVSDRLGILLQHLKAGDTLCGLTSCSGPLPSQSRGH